MKIIPRHYQELETIVDSINCNKARCIGFCAPNGGEGVSSLAVSVAKRLTGRNAKVLLIDLNSCNPMTQADLSSMPKRLEAWSFGDISCQLNTQNIEDFDFLSITRLQDLALVREKDVFSMAILMLLQEFDYILFDTSPLCNKNHANFPLHLLSAATDLMILQIALGKTTQENLDAAVSELKAVKCKHYEIIASQIYMPPLGDRLIDSINRRVKRFPKLKHRLRKIIKKQDWLFHGA